MNKIIIGLLAATVAVGSSVTFNPEKKYSTGDWYGQSLSGYYVKFNTPYLLGLCLPLSINPCAFYETAAGDGHIPNSFSSQQAFEWEDDGYLIGVGSGYYLGL
ncbi:hypothetical protein OQY15_11475 [Pedobacter sp. MC2016-15]|uniref:hypothetical protein n=1 Tax=Pedobacter sp. MC2016-15 TaxID=2994473 RepID=UPI0022452301|nr:hypothetical protein [Pedobacter sp. MC2016-15]MCX2479707.1 hypothetical protein [Pedobacter sp. MC2016-15]